MKDLTGVTINEGSRVLLFRPGGGGAVGKVVDILGESIAVQTKIEIKPDMSQRKGWLTEQAHPQTVLVLK